MPGNKGRGNGSGCRLPRLPGISVGGVTSSYVSMEPVRGGGSSTAGPVASAPA